MWWDVGEIMMANIGISVKRLKNGVSGKKVWITVSLKRSEY